MVQIFRDTTRKMASIVSMRPEARQAITPRLGRDRHTTSPACAGVVEFLVAPVEGRFASRLGLLGVKCSVADWKRRIMP